MNFLNQYEIVVLEFIQEHLKCGFLDVFCPFITKFGDAGIFWIIVAIALMCFKKTRKTGFTVGLALFMGVVVGNGILKPLVARVRPYDFKEGFELLVPALSDYSFPSGHSLASFEAAGVLMICDRKRFGYASLALAILIALSRLYLCVHYPTDVLAGVILGLLFAYLSYKIINLIYAKIEEKKKTKVVGENNEK